ncbi:MAG: asparagine synthase-related protein, partial [Acidobacteriota bacterium]
SASIEARFPFLDEAVVRFAINLPLRYKLRLGTRFHDWKHPFVIDKWLVRELAARRLPASLADKRKNGFPMYGHHHVEVEPGLFDDGFWPWLLGLDRDGVAHMIAHADPYWNAKAASVEVWGRLFVLKQSLAEVQEHLRRHVSLRL